MKCESCGGELHIEDERCPHCGELNPHYQEHRADMNRYAQDYGRTRNEVLQKTSFFTGYTVKITVIAVLAALELAALFVQMNSWNIISYFRERMVAHNQAEYLQIMDDYERNGEYMALTAFYNENYLYYNDSFDEYNKVVYAGSYYGDVYTYMLQLVTGTGYQDYEYDIEYICKELEYFYDSVKPGAYEDEIRYSGLHGESLAAMQEEVKYLLITYGGLDEETTEGFEDLSNSRKQLALEEGMRQYEKESDF